MSNQVSNLDTSPDSSGVPSVLPPENSGLSPLPDWLEASYEQGGLTTGRNFERLIRLLETIEDNRIMEAIRAKDRATAKKIVRKMEERAKRRAMEKTVEAAKPLRAIGDHGGDRKTYQDSKIESRNLISGGTNSAYRISRIKRDHPTLAERIMAGEFKSVSEAERAAGLRPPLLTDYEKAQRAFWRLTEEACGLAYEVLNALASSWSASMPIS